MICVEDVVIIYNTLFLITEPSMKALHILHTFPLNVFLRDTCNDVKREGNKSLVKI